MLGSIFVKDDSSAGHIKMNGVDVFRVNIIATIVYKDENGNNYSSAVIDDGSGKILLRSFNGAGIFSDVDVSDPVLVIGRVREFNDERYIIPEILKKLDDINWITLRKLELAGHMKNAAADANIKDKGGEVAGASEDVYLLVKKLDDGSGALIDDVLKASNNPDAEGILNKLLENGDVFEVKPGKLKVLE